MIKLYLKRRLDIDLQLIRKDYDAFSDSQENKIFIEQKFQEFEENCYKLLTNKFWDLFFEKLFKEFLSL